MVSLEFFSDIILPVSLWTWDRLSLQQKKVPGVFPQGKGGRCVRLTSCAAVMKSGNPNFLEPSGPLQACNGTALPFTTQFMVSSTILISIMTQQRISGPGPPHYQGFTITLRHTTFGRTPLDELSARRRDLYLTTHNTHSWQTSMPQAGFELVIPAFDRPQTNALDSADTRIFLSHEIYYG